MLSIDEAIKKHKKLKILAEGTNDKRGSFYSAEEHEQLANWLEELKAYKKNSNTCHMCDTYCSYLADEFENGYNKSIDDFIHECDKCCGFYTGNNKNLTREDMLKIAEQLKAGGKNER